MFKKVSEAFRSHIKEANKANEIRSEKEAWEYCKNHFEKRIEESQKNLRR